MSSKEFAGESKKPMLINKMGAAKIVMHVSHLNFPIDITPSRKLVRIYLLTLELNSSQNLKTDDCKVVEICLDNPIFSKKISNCRYI